MSTTDNDTYIVWVRFERSLSDDMNAGLVAGDPTPKKLAQQLALELQEGYDMAGIAGTFQCVTVVIGDKATNVEPTMDDRRVADLRATLHLTEDQWLNFPDIVRQSLLSTHRTNYDWSDAHGFIKR